MPTRQGVQKPQLSWAKKCGEVANHLEHVAAVVEHHEGAGGGQILEGDLAVEFARVGRTAPDGPPIWTAWACSAPQSSSTWRTLRPNGYS